jgi:hypothetical protein
MKRKGRRKNEKETKLNRTKMVIHTHNALGIQFPEWSWVPIF